MSNFIYILTTLIDSTLTSVILAIILGSLTALFYKKANKYINTTTLIFTFHLFIFGVVTFIFGLKTLDGTAEILFNINKPILCGIVIILFSVVSMLLGTSIFSTMLLNKDNEK